MPSLRKVALCLALVFVANAVRNEDFIESQEDAGITDKDCQDIIPDSEARDSAWRHTNGCKCAKGSLMAGEADECIKHLGQRYFPRDANLKGRCTCQFKLLDVELATDASDTNDDEQVPQESIQKLPAWDCAEYSNHGLEAGDLVRIIKEASHWHNTVHVVTCPKVTTLGTKGRVCLRQGYKNSGCWGAGDLEKVMDIKVDSFQGALKKFTGNAELTLANFYQAASEPGAWSLDNLAPTLFNLAGVLMNFGKNPPPESLVRWWEEQTCDASFKDEIGVFTLGISYDRADTVDSNVEKLVGSELLAGMLGNIVRSDLLSGNVGASYTAINNQLTGQVPDKVKDGLADRFFDLAETDARSSRHLKKGMVLIEFKVCKVSSQVRFFQCHIGGSMLNDAEWIGHGTWGDFLATRGWRLLANIPGLGYKLNPVIMGGIKTALPDQVMNGLAEAVGGANICFFEGGITDGGDRTQELFKDLMNETVCPQREAKPPPPVPKGCMEPPELPADEEKPWWQR